MAFSESPTPFGNWRWAKWMHEDGEHLTKLHDQAGPGPHDLDARVRLLAQVKDAISGEQLEGLTGHVEYFPTAFALRHKFQLAKVDHASADTFTSCCPGKQTARAENWYEGWKQTGARAPLRLLHPPIVHRIIAILWRSLAHENIVIALVIKLS